MARSASRSRFESNTVPNLQMCDLGTDYAKGYQRVWGNELIDQTGLFL